MPCLEDSDKAWHLARQPLRLSATFPGRRDKGLLPLDRRGRLA